MLDREAHDPEIVVRWHPRKFFGLPPAGDIAFRADRSGLSFAPGSGLESFGRSEVVDLAIFPRYRPRDAEGIVIGGRWFASWRAPDIVDMRLLLRDHVVKMVRALVMNDAEIDAMLDLYNLALPTDDYGND